METKYKYDVMLRENLFLPSVQWEGNVLWDGEGFHEMNEKI